LVTRSRRGAGALIAATFAAPLSLSVALSLLLSLATALPAQAQTATTDPAVAAAAWLPSQLTDGERVVLELEGMDPFTDVGLTIDVLIALATAGVGADTIADIADWLEGEVAGYSGADGSYSAGGTAKLVLAAQVVDRDPTAFGGVDLLERLRSLESDAGRFSDVERDDFSNVVTQSLAILALERDGSGASDAAVGFLVDSACDDGGFPSFFDQQPCDSAVDATAFAVQALSAVGEDATAQAAGDWLAATAQDEATGGFGDAFSGLNANSTGLAIPALRRTGHDDAAEAATSYLFELQLGCDVGGQEAGAIRLTADDTEGDARATAQAVVGLLAADLTEVSAEGAVAELPVLDCEAAGAGDGDDDAAADESDEEVVGDAAAEDVADEDVDATDGTGDDEASVEVEEEPVAAEDGGSSVWWWVVALLVVATVVAVVVLQRRKRTAGTTAP
jgi:hypothetical protein